MLNEQLKQQIATDAEVNTRDFKDSNDYEAGIIQGYKEGYEVAGEHYVELWQAAEEKAARYEKALKDFARQIKMHCNKMGIRSVVIQCIANRMEELDITEALTPKTGEDE